MGEALNLIKKTNSEASGSLFRLDFPLFKMEFLPYSSTYADYVRELCLWNVCMRTPSVFL